MLDGKFMLLKEEKKFMKIALAVCKCEINFNSDTTTFMSTENVFDMVDFSLEFNIFFIGQFICLAPYFPLSFEIH